MTHSFVISYYHLIFCTKNRSNLISPSIEPKLYEYLCTLSQYKKSYILKINGTSNHIHLLVKLYSNDSISNFTKNLKGASSIWMKQQGEFNFQWQEGYAALACFSSHLEVVEKYIENQKNHHKTKTLDGEILEIEKIYNSLNKH